MANTSCSRGVLVSVVVVSFLFASVFYFSSKNTDTNPEVICATHNTFISKLTSELDLVKAQNSNLKKSLEDAKHQHELIRGESRKVVEGKDAKILSLESAELEARTAAESCDNEQQALRKSFNNMEIRLSDAEKAVANAKESKRLMEEKLAKAEQKINELRTQLKGANESEKAEPVRIVVNRSYEPIHDTFAFWMNCSQNFPITVYNKGTDDIELPHPDTTFIKGVNEGRECNGYLTYIIDNYDNLPDVSIFLHPGAVYHSNQLCSKINNIRERVLAKKTPDEDPIQFIHLNDLQLFRCTGAIVDWCCSLDRRALEDLFSWWGIKDQWPKGPPACYGTPCCAQFAVSRQRILQRSKDAYIKTRDWVNGGGNSHHLCYVMEHAWHVLFGEPPILQGIPKTILESHHMMLQDLLKDNHMQDCHVKEYIETARSEGRPLAGYVTEPPGPIINCTRLGK